DRSREITDAENELGRRNEGVAAARHRHRAGVPGFAFEDPLAAHDPDDPLRETERHARALEHRPLLDVNLEETLGQVGTPDEGRAADAAALLVPEHDRGALADALDRLDRGNDAQGAVELAAVGNGIEVRARPDRGVPGAADQVACVVDLDLEARLQHPPRRELVRSILTVAAADAVRTEAAADGVQLLQPVERPHSRHFPRLGVRPQQLASEPERIERLRARRDEDALRLQIELERLEAQLATEARLLVAAERNAGERRVRHVDPDGARLDPARDAMAACRIPGPDGRQPPVAH